MKRKTLYSFVSLIVMAAFIVMSSCKKDDTDNGIQKYSIGGTVEGLIGTGLVLQNNNGDDLSISENGTFTFPTLLDDSSAYDVTIESYPAGQTCYILNESGMVDGENVTDIEVVCQAVTFIGDCPSGSIDYYHVLANDYGAGDQTFHQDEIVSGTVSFICCDTVDFCGTGTVDIDVNGTITSTCTLAAYEGSAIMNVTLTGSLTDSELIINLDEIWHVGSPMGIGTITNTCDPDSSPFEYPLLEGEVKHTLTFPKIDGYKIERPFVGMTGSGTYSWTLHLD